MTSNPITLHLWPLFLVFYISTNDTIINEAHTIHKSNTSDSLGDKAVDERYFTASEAKSPEMIMLLW